MERWYFRYLSVIVQGGYSAVVPRPTPPPHPIEQFLADHHAGQVGASTVKKYARILRRMEKSKQEPELWLRAQVQKLSTGQRASRTTVGVMRSAVLYHLRHRHFERTGELLDQIGAEAEYAHRLPKISEGRRGTSRSALTASQYELYLDTVLNLATHPQIKAVLLLLPLTGLRIFEACGLKGKNVIRRGSEWTLSVIGKGDKPRTIPLDELGRSLVEPFADEAGDDDFIFTNPCLGLPGSTRLDLSPAQVRAVVRDEIQKVEELTDVVPHVLRHHFATASIRAGVDVFTAKELLGHASTKTMERYAHPDEDMKRAAIEKVRGVLSRKRLES